MLMQRSFFTLDYILLVAVSILSRAQPAVFHCLLGIKRFASKQSDRYINKIVQGHNFVKTIIKEKQLPRVGLSH